MVGEIEGSGTAVIKFIMKIVETEIGKFYKGDSALAKMSQNNENVVRVVN